METKLGIQEILLIIMVVGLWILLWCFQPHQLIFYLVVKVSLQVY